MDCFEHPGVSAVGVCKACGRAVCRTCVGDSATDLRCVRCASRSVAQASGFPSHDTSVRAWITAAASALIWCTAYEIAAFTGVHYIQTGQFQFKRVLADPLLVLTGLIGAPIVAYFVWSLYWGIASLCTAWSRSTRATISDAYRRLTGGALAFAIAVFIFGFPLIAALTLLYFLPPVIVAVFYGPLGGGIMQYVRYRRLHVSSSATSAKASAGA